MKSYLVLALLLGAGSSALAQGSLPSDAPAAPIPARTESVTLPEGAERTSTASTAPAAATLPSDNVATTPSSSTANAAPAAAASTVTEAARVHREAPQGTASSAPAQPAAK